MIKFSHNYSTSFKIKNKIAIGYFRDDNFLEIWYRGIKCEIPVNCNDEFFIIDDNIEEFKENLFKEYKKKIKLSKRK